MSDIKRVQVFLIAQGYDLGKGGDSGKGDDGIAGRLTQAALADWQGKHGLQPSGFIDDTTLRTMFGQDAVMTAGDPPWFELCLRKKGLHEGRDFEELRRFLKSDGKTLGDPRKLPWCGDLVETCIALTLPKEILPGNPYWARNWATFGRPTDASYVGAVLSFTRPGGGGHVCFSAGKEGKYLKCAGGNQSNSISITRIAASRLIAARWPLTYPLPTVIGSGHAATGVSSNEA